MHCPPKMLNISLNSKTTSLASASSPSVMSFFFMISIYTALATLLATRKNTILLYAMQFRFSLHQPETYCES